MTVVEVGLIYIEKIQIQLSRENAFTRCYMLSTRVTFLKVSSRHKTGGQKIIELVLLEKTLKIVRIWLLTQHCQVNTKSCPSAVYLCIL